MTDICSPRAPEGLPSSEFADPRHRDLPLGLWAHPIFPLLYVGFVTVNRLGVYAYNSYGHLTFLRSVPNSGQAICWLRVNGSGTRLYSTDTGSNSVSVYDLSLPEEPREIQKPGAFGPGECIAVFVERRREISVCSERRGSATIPMGKGTFCTY